MDDFPARVVTATAATYACIFAGSQYFSWPTENPRANLKAISSLHSIVTTAVGLAALLESWPVDTTADSPSHKASNRYLDDRQNPLISGRSNLGNAVTSFETGYLLYDNIALFLVTRSEVRNSFSSPSVAALSHLVKKEPLLVVHHVAILSALGILQTYIAKGNERGIWIIVAFILMRASDPVLHWRWWLRKSSGKPDTRLDLLLAAVFAICRFGTITWVLRAYGSHHNLDAWNTFNKQRLVCKAGTGTLFGLNALWLAILLRNTGTRILRDRKRN